MMSKVIVSFVFLLLVRSISFGQVESDVDLVKEVKSKILRLRKLQSQLAEERAQYELNRTEIVRPDPSHPHLITQLTRENKPQEKNKLLEIDITRLKGEVDILEESINLSLKEYEIANDQNFKETSSLLDSSQLIDQAGIAVVTQLRKAKSQVLASAQDANINLNHSFIIALASTPQNLIPSEVNLASQVSIQKEIALALAATNDAFTAAIKFLEQIKTYALGQPPEFTGLLAGNYQSLDQAVFIYRVWSNPRVELYQVHNLPDAIKQLNIMIDDVAAIENEVHSEVSVVKSKVDLALSKTLKNLELTNEAADK